MRLITLAVALLVAFAAGVSVASAKVVYERDGQIWIAGNQGGSERLLARGISPTPSPDGRWIAFYRPTSPDEHTTGALYVSPTRGGRARRLTQDALGITWDPTSRMIVTETYRGLVRVDTHVPREREIETYGDRCGVTFAPDGRLAVSTCGSIDVFDRRLKLVDLVRVLGKGAEDVLWGPKGLAYVWSSRPPKNPSDFYPDPNPDPRRFELRLIPLKGREITLDKRGLVPVAWSADGNQLLTGLSLVTLTPRSVEPISTGGIPNDLSDDGRTALFTRPDGLYAVSVGTRQATPIAPQATLIAPGASAGAFIGSPRRGSRARVR